MFKRNSHYHMHGKRKKIPTFRSMEDSSYTPKTMIKRQQWELLNQCLRYIPDIMASHQSKQKQINHRFNSIFH